MINPGLKAIDRIHDNLPVDLKARMREHILPEEVHQEILKNIKRASYEGKSPVEKPKFIMVVGQTGSGKSNLTASLCAKDSNLVVIDSDKYKGFRPDSEEIQRNHQTEYAFLTAPDSYWHRDQMIVDAISKKYNILMECATSQKEGLFIDISELIKEGYEVEICVLGVSALNSLLSVHERYEDLLEHSSSSAKLTGVARHDDSFKSLNTAIKDVQNMRGVKVNVYERGKEPPYFPKQIYSSTSDERRYSCALEALIDAQSRDEKMILQGFEERVKAVEEKMRRRQAPKTQLEQLAVVQERYEEKITENIKED